MNKIAAIIFSVLLLGIVQVYAQTYNVVVYNPPAGFNDVTVAGIGGEQRVGQGRLTGMPYPTDGHALLWLGNSPQPIDLHPTSGGWIYSEAFGTDGTRQVGYIKKFNGPYIIQNAVIWSSSANSFVILSTYYSAAVAIGGDQQVGFVSTSLSCSECGPTGGDYAVLWRGTPESAVVLNPVGFSDASVADTDGVQQVGGGTSNAFPTDFRDRALLWYGTRQSFVDLTPNGYRYAFAAAVSNGTQVGRAALPGDNRYHAIVWHNTKDNFSDLGYGILNDTNGTTHVGLTTGENGSTHAFRWDGDSGAKVDLHPLLPAGLFRYSYATGINANGDIVGWGQTNDYRSIGFLLRRTDTNNVAPTVSLTSPALSGSYLLKAMRGLTAHAADSDGSIASVEFYVNDQSIGAGIPVGNGTGIGTGSGDYRIPWSPAQIGTYQLKVKATDNLGAVSFSPSISVNLTNRYNPFDIFGF